MPERYNRQVIHIQSGKTKAQTVLGFQGTISRIINTSITLLHTLVITTKPAIQAPLLSQQTDRKAPQSLPTAPPSSVLRCVARL